MNEQAVNSIMKTQTGLWVFAILFASGYALFAKLIWTHKFPILIFLPLLMVGFAIAGLNHLRTALSSLDNSKNSSE